MKIQISEALKSSAPSQRVLDAIEAFIKIKDVSEVPHFVDSLELDDSEDVRCVLLSSIFVFVFLKSFFFRSKQLDLSHWIDALNRIDDIFTELGPWIPVCGELRIEPSEGDCIAKEVLARRVICSILRFLRMMLKTGKEKRFFVCQEVRREIF